jgi:hypothetical protein
MAGMLAYSDEPPYTKLLQRLGAITKQ